MSKRHSSCDGVWVMSTDDLFWDKEWRTFSQEASSLGFATGEWPHKITVRNPKTEGESDFFFKEFTYNHDEIASAIYQNASTITLQIWND